MVVARYVYVVALTIWLGGMVALGMIAAPSTFHVLEGRMPGEGRVLAGAVFGEVLRRFHLVTYAAGGLMLVAFGVMAMLGPRPRAFGVRLAIVSAMLALSVFTGVWISGQIEQLQREIGGPVSSLSQQDPRRARFGQLHGLATVLMTINIAGGLVLLYWEALE